MDGVQLQWTAELTGRHPLNSAKPTPKVKQTAPNVDDDDDDPHCLNHQLKLNTKLKDNYVTPIRNSYGLRSVW